MTCPTPRTYYVLSHETLLYPGSDMGLEPPEYGRFVDVVQATSKHEAIRVAYANPNAEIHQWAEQARGDGRNPFAGITVEHHHCEHGVCLDAPLGDGGFNCDDCRALWADEILGDWMEVGA